MTDDRLARRLRAADVPEAPDPAFVSRLYGELANELGFAERRVAPLAARRRPTIRPGRLLLAAALLLPLTVGLVLVGAALLRAPEDDRLDLVRDAGQLRIAISRDHPQIVMPGGAIEGFEVDVAREVAARLGLTAEFVVGDTAMPIATGSPWDLAVTSTLLADDETAEVLVAEPIAWWPITMIVAADSPANSVDAVRGRVGATPGSSADRWLRGELGAGPEDVPAPPTGLSLVPTKSDLGCLDRLLASDLDACLTTALVPADLEARPQVRAVEGSPVVDPRGLVVPRSGPDSASLVTEVRRVIGELRDDGTLRELSLRRFGTDVTVPPTR